MEAKIEQQELEIENSLNEAIATGSMYPLIFALDSYMDSQSYSIWHFTRVLIPNLIPTAIKLGFAEILRFLVWQTAKEIQYLALLRAIESGNEALVIALCDDETNSFPSKCGPLNIPLARNPISSLSAAIINGQAKIANYLLSRNNRLEEYSKRELGSTDLILWAALGRLELITSKYHPRFLQAHPNAFNYLNARDALGYTALMRAAQAGNADVVDYLLSLGANPHIQSKEAPKQTALDIAVDKGHEAVVAVLLKDPKRFISKPTDLQNAKKKALKQNKINMLSIIAKAEMNIADCPLSQARSQLLILLKDITAKNGDQQKYALLKELKADIQKQPFDSEEALKTAAKNVILLSLQRAHFGFLNTTRSGSIIKAKLNDPKFNALKALLGFSDAPVRYRDLRSLLLGKNDEKAFSSGKRKALFDGLFAEKRQADGCFVSELQIQTFFSKGLKCSKEDPVAVDDMLPDEEIVQFIKNRSMGIS